MSTSLPQRLDKSPPPPPHLAGVPAGDGSSTLPRALAELADIQFRLGEWTAAYGSARESIRAACACGSADDSSRGFARLALIDAGRGDAGACRAYAAAAIGERRSRRSPLVDALAQQALGLLELGFERLDPAIEHLEAVAMICANDRRADRFAATWALDLADARLLRGDRVGARRAVALLEERARRSRSWVLVAASERCRAVLAAEDAFELPFLRALAWSVRARQPFERARTELRFGERLRRARHPHEARTRLAAARDIFKRLGARPWADAAGRELALAA
jgi:hypothetical protein